YLRARASGYPMSALLIPDGERTFRATSSRAPSRPRSGAPPPHLSGEGSPQPQVRKPPTRGPNRRYPSVAPLDDDPSKNRSIPRGNTMVGADEETQPAAPGPLLDATGVPSTEKAPTVAPRPDVYAGTVIDGRYVVEKNIGEGGMGFVYLGRHKVIAKKV